MRLATPLNGRIMEPKRTTAALLRWGFSLLYSSKAFKGLTVRLY